MKIAILTSGILPVPAVRGGAVENLIDFYLEYNEVHHLHDITVYSIDDQQVHGHRALSSRNNHYHFIKTDTLGAKICKKMYHLFNRKNEYYNYNIEYFLYKSIKHIHRNHYDAIILENRPGYALKLKKLTDSKLIYHLHNDNLNSNTYKSQELYQLATSIITVSDYIRMRILTINVSDSKSIVVHNGIDLSSFSHCNQLLYERKDFGISEGDFIVVFSGRLTEEKGILQLITAFHKLTKYSKIKLLIVGGSFYGRNKDDNMFVKKLKEKAYNIQDKIIFTGFKPYHDVPSILALADVAVLPSIWNEPFGLTLVEAMAMGLPIVSTSQGGIPEVLTPDCSIVLDKNDQLPDNIATSILSLYNNPKQRAKMSEASIKQSKLFDKEQYAKNFFAVIDRYS